MHHTIFLFGEAEKGAFCTPIPCRSLAELTDTLGNPPEESLGIPYAVQALMYKRGLIFFRVKEEGFSVEDYMKGIHFLQKNELPTPPTAICLPGVGDTTIIDGIESFCKLHSSLLIINDKDLYDYLTIRPLM